MLTSVNTKLYYTFTLSLFIRYTNKKINFEEKTACLYTRVKYEGKKELAIEQSETC